jgi:ssDNA-binding Zn-finger/Zn-ribbon topoisomerase 1
MAEVLTKKKTSVLTDEEIEMLLTAINAGDGGSESFKNIEEFNTFLTERHQREEPYGIFTADITMCRFFESKNSENILADIERKNKEQGMGNYQIPKTNIKLINYSICPKCEHVFSFKDLTDYYSNPQPDKIFKNRAEQYREDTRVLCKECNTYFLPALVIVDRTPKNEVQFLCRVQTVNAIEKFYQGHVHGKRVLSARKKNILRKEDTMVKAIRNDVLLRELTPKPTLISNLLQYTPAHLALNLIDGSNVEKSDVLFGTWC